MTPERGPAGAGPEGTVSDEALHKAEAYIEAEEGAANRLGGAIGVFVTLAAVAMSLFHLYTAYAIVPTQTLRPVHVGWVLALTFLLFPAAARWRHRLSVTGDSSAGGRGQAQ